MDIKIYVTTIKKYKMPEDTMYIPMQVGSVLREDFGYLRDDSTDNISAKNITYSEYTAFYWIWKNAFCMNEQESIFGFNRYRRYFTTANKFRILFTKDKYRLLLSRKQIENIFSVGYECILPKITNIGLCSVRENYGKSEGRSFEEIDAAGVAIKELFPSYYESYRYVINKRYAYFRSIFLMKCSLYNKYSNWLFSILEYLEINYKFSSDRVYGYLAERLINVFIHYEQIKIKELNCVHMELKSTIGLWYIKVVFSRLLNKYIYMNVNKRKKI